MRGATRARARATITYRVLGPLRWYHLPARRVEEHLRLVLGELAHVRRAVKNEGKGVGASASGLSLRYTVQPTTYLCGSSPAPAIPTIWAAW